MSFTLKLNIPRNTPLHEAFYLIQELDSRSNEHSPVERDAMIQAAKQAAYVLVGSQCVGDLTVNDYDIEIRGHANTGNNGQAWHERDSVTIHIEQGYARTQGSREPAAEREEVGV